MYNHRPDVFMTKLSPVLVASDSQRGIYLSSVCFIQTTRSLVSTRQWLNLNISYQNIPEDYTDPLTQSAECKVYPAV